MRNHIIGAVITGIFAVVAVIVSYALNNRQFESSIESSPTAEGSRNSDAKLVQPPPAPDPILTRPKEKVGASQELSRDDVDAGKHHVEGFYLVVKNEILELVDGPATDADIDIFNRGTVCVLLKSAAHDYLVNTLPMNEKNIVLFDERHEVTAAWKRDACDAAFLDIAGYDNVRGILDRSEMYVFHYQTRQP